MPPFNPPPRPNRPGNDAALSAAQLALSDEAKPARRVEQIAVRLILPDESQPRTLFDERDLRDFAAAIIANGQLQPINVEAVSGGKYLIITGERRWRAALVGKIEFLDAVVWPVALSPEKRLEIQLSENIDRADLTLADLCRSIERFRAFGRTYKYLADGPFRKLAKGDEDWVGERARAWKGAAPETRSLMERHGDVFTHVQQIVRLPEKRQKDFVEMVRDGATVGQVRDAVRDVLAPKAPAPTLSKSTRGGGGGAGIEGENESGANASNAGTPAPQPEPEPEPAPKATQEEVEGLDWDFGDAPAFDAAALTRTLDGARSCLDTATRHAPTVADSSTFTPLARDALLTQLERLKAQCEEVASLLSRSNRSNS